MNAHLADKNGKIQQTVYVTCFAELIHYNEKFYVRDKRHTAYPLFVETALIEVE